MVGEAVEESSGQPFRAEHLGPLDEGQVGGHQDRSTRGRLAWLLRRPRRWKCSSEIRRSYRSAGHWSALYSRLQRRGIDPHRYNDSGFARSRRPDQQMPTPTATPTPLIPGSITPVPASETYRLDLGLGVVVAFVEGLSPDMPDKVAYVTHVPSGSQAVLDRDGQVIDRHDGRGDGPSHLDAVLQDRAAKDRIMEVSRAMRTCGPARRLPSGRTPCSSAASPTWPRVVGLDP